MKQIDRLRSMNAEELAEFLLKNKGIYRKDTPRCYDMFLKNKIKWLESEVEE